MNFKSRIKNLEKVYHVRGINENVLLSPGYGHKGEPFNSIDEMRVKLNVEAMSPYFTDDQIKRLLMNNLLSYKCSEVKRLVKNTCDWMKEHT